MPSFLSSLASHAKAHHDSLNAAYTVYYAPGSSTSTSASSSLQTSRNNSVVADMPAAPKAQRAPTNAQRAWAAVKKHRREMNYAYRVYYSPGGTAVRSGSGSGSA